MPPSDPAAVPPPEWAVDAAYAYFNLPLSMAVKPKCAEDIKKLARLLASVREGALREAAGAVIAHPAFVAKYPNDFANAILSLLHTPPSGGGA